MHFSITSDAVDAYSQDAAVRRAELAHSDGVLRGLVVLAIVAVLTGLIFVSNVTEGAHAGVRAAFAAEAAEGR